jgi:hypothetical protein
MSNKTVIAAVAFVLLSGVLAHAQTTQLSQSGSDSSSSQGKSHHTQLVILSTKIDRANDTLTIRGIGFGSRIPQVYCETHPMTVISATDSKIVVHLPDSTHDGSYLLTVFRGYQSTERDVFDMGITSVDSGPAGPKGDTGAAGRQGDTGAAGPQGETGAVGPKGDTGAAGPKGDVGAAGPKGDNGAVGPKGDTGAAGAKGDSGDVGPIGAAGPQGVNGETGPTGAQGPKGDAGAAGDTGPAGPAGLQGSAGPQGADGSQGAAGPQGPGGVQGPMGLQGPVGPAGPAGVSGYEVVVQRQLETINGNRTSVGVAACPVGKRIIGGGFENANVNLPLYPVASFPSVADNSWKVTVRLTQITAASVDFRIYAVCVAE